VVSILGSQVDLALLTVSTAVQYVEAGQIVPLGVFNDEPDAAKPDWPLGASGGLDANLPLVFTLYATKGWPTELSAKFDAALARITAKDEFKQKIAQLNQTMSYRNAKDTATYVEKEFNFVKQVIEASKAKGGQN
jgi:tripartite-type tricarboxylate transporter receptor subunit TctC